MKNINLQRINNERFSIRLCNIAESYGFKTIGTFEKFLLPLENKGNYLTLHGFRFNVNSLLKEIREYKLNQQIE